MTMARLGMILAELRMVLTRLGYGIGGTENGTYKTGYDTGRTDKTVVWYWWD